MPRILTVDAKIKTVKEMSLLMDRLSAVKQPVVIICKDISDDAMAEVIYNVKRNTIRLSVVTLHGSDDYITESLADLATLFDSKLFSELNFEDLFELENHDLGKASKIDMTKMETFFITSESKSEEHKQRINSRLREIEFQYRTASGTKKQLLEDRLTRLSGNMALIKIGGNSEAEQKEVKDKLTDGLNAVRNIMEYGGLPGGGAALVHGSKILKFLPRESDQEVNNGITIMEEALKEPMRYIIDNAGLQGTYFVEQISNKFTDPWWGFDLRKEKFGNMKDLGVVDSFHNLKNILIDASSIGSLLLTTECVVHRVKRYIGRSS